MYAAREASAPSQAPLDKDRLLRGGEAVNRVMDFRLSLAHIGRDVSLEPAVAGSIEQWRSGLDAFHQTIRDSEGQSAVRLWDAPGNPFRQELYLGKGKKGTEHVFTAVKAFLEDTTIELHNSAWWTNLHAASRIQQAAINGAEASVHRLPLDQMTLNVHISRPSPGAEVEYSITIDPLTGFNSVGNDQTANRDAYVYAVQRGVGLSSPGFGSGPNARMLATDVLKTSLPV